MSDAPTPKTELPAEPLLGRQWCEVERLQRELAAAQEKLKQRDEDAEWISVNDRLPDNDNVEVLVYGVTNKYEVTTVGTIRRYLRAAKRDGDDCYFQKWMPLAAIDAARRGKGKNG